MNVLIAGDACTRGGLAFDSAPSVKNPAFETSSAVLAYARVIDLWGMSSTIDAVAPYTWLSGSADAVGEPVERIVDGFADPRFRISVNRYGAPARSLAELREQEPIVGASLQVSAPWGQYDDSRAGNIGTNRSAFKPELGVSKTIRGWTLEVDATWFSGGRRALNGVTNDDVQENWRLGGTLAFPVDVHNSIKRYASSGVSAHTGNRYDLIGVALQYRWGGVALTRGAPMLASWVVRLVGLRSCRLCQRRSDDGGRAGFRAAVGCATCGHQNENR